jgi:hypothetical protein
MKSLSSLVLSILPPTLPHNSSSFI